jgi:hypothetical protein
MVLRQFYENNPLLMLQKIFYDKSLTLCLLVPAVVDLPSNSPAYYCSAGRLTTGFLSKLPAETRDK